MEQAHGPPLARPAPLGDTGRPGERTGQPAGEPRIGLRCLAARAGIRRDGPLVAGAAAGLHDRAPLEQPRFGEPLELQPDRIGVPPDAFRQLLCGRRAQQLGEDGQQLQAHRQGEHVAGRRARDLHGSSSLSLRRLFTKTSEKVVGIPRDVVVERKRDGVSESGRRRELLVSKGWVQAVALVVLFGFFVLGLLAYRTYQAKPPIPQRVVAPGGEVLYTADDVEKGQQVFLHNGLMEYGSVFGTRVNNCYKR